MKMTILRAQEKLEMDVDMEVTTDVVNIDYSCNESDSKDWIMTLYGTEKDGELYYITLDQNLLGVIEHMLRHGVEQFEPMKWATAQRS